VTDLRDLQIYKFADMFLYIKKYFGEIDWNLLVSRVQKYGLGKVVFYNFYYVTLMFGDIIPPEVMNSLKPDDLAYLDEYGIENKEPARWEYDFFTRLFDTSRILTIDKDKAGNSERFLNAKISADGVMHHMTRKNKDI